MYGVIPIALDIQSVFCSLAVLFNLLFCYIDFRTNYQDLGFYRWLLLYYAVFEIVFAITVFFTLPIHMISEHTWFSFSFKGPLIGTRIAYVSSAIYCLFYEMWLGMVMVNFIYRYIALCQPDWLYKIKNKLKLKLMLIAVYVSFNVMCAFCTLYLCAVNKITDSMKETLKTEYGLGEEVDNMGYIMLRLIDIDGNISFSGIAATSIHIQIVCASLMVTIFCSYNIVREIRQMQSMLVRRITLERQLFVALLIQSIIPMFLCQIPSAINLSFPFWTAPPWFAPAEPFFAAMTTIPKTLDPIITIACVSVYRNYFLKMIGIKKKETNIVSSTLASSTAYVTRA